MGNCIDLTGQKIGKLTVIKRASNYKDGSARWLCKCDCGNEKIIAGYNLRRGHTNSCGCNTKIEASKKKGIKNSNFKHGKSKTRLHGIWRGMQDRCYNPNNADYEHYGGRGIVVCKEWLEDFINFYNWAIVNGYKKELSVDRINNNGNYEPNNCRWADNALQIRNQGVRNTNKTGIKGIVLRDNGNYRVTLGIRGKSINLGTYKSLQEAKEVRKRAELKYWRFTNID